MTKISITECQLEEGMRKAKAHHPDSHTHTLCPSRRRPPGPPSSWNKNKHLLSLTLMNMEGVTTPRGPEPQKAHPRPPKGLDGQQSPDLGGRDLCWWSVASSKGGAAWAILRPDMSN